MTPITNNIQKHIGNRYYPKSVYCNTKPKMAKQKTTYRTIQDTHSLQCGERKNSMKPSEEEYKDIAEKVSESRYIPILTLKP